MQASSGVTRSGNCCANAQQRLGDRPSLREMYPRVQVHTARRRAVAPFDSCPTRRSPRIPPPHFLSDGLDTGPHQTKGSDLGNGEFQVVRYCRTDVQQRLGDQTSHVQGTPRGCTFAKPEGRFTDACKCFRGLCLRSPTDRTRLTPSRGGLLTSIRDGVLTSILDGSFTPTSAPHYV